MLKKWIKNGRKVVSCGMDTAALLLENQELKTENERLKFRLAELLRLIHGQKSERFVSPSSTHSTEQLLLDFGEVAPVDISAAEAASPEVEEITYQRKKQQHPGRHPIPAHLPAEEVVIMPQASVEGLQEIGKTVVETLEYKPGSLIRRRYILPKYALANGGGVLQGSMPSRPLPKSIAESGLLSYLITQKFVYHLPFYRLIQLFKQEYDARLRANTLNDWFTGVCELLQPLYECLRKKVLASGYIQADESPIQVQDEQKQGNTHKGYQWIYSAPLLDLLFFEYQKGRGENSPKELLKQFSGTLQTDGYEVYDKLVKHRDDIVHAGCMAHARRYFFKAKDVEPLAETALAYFARLYAIERHIKEQEMDSNATQLHRQQEAIPVLNTLFAWAEEQRAGALPKSPFGKALHYLLQRKEKLTRYCHDGNVEIDNNLVENSIRPLALGRKNYLFAGSHDAAQRIAMMYSFFGSCKKQNINPQQWLKAVLDKIATHPINKIEELLPGKWVTAQDP